MRVVHVSEKVEGALFIGRPSKWGNPFKMKSEADREEVIRLYEKHLRTDPELWYALPELRSYEALECFCAPKPCHGDVLVRLQEQHFDERGVPYQLRIAVTGSREGVSYETVAGVLQGWAGHYNHWVLGGALGVDNHALRFCQENDEEYWVLYPADRGLKAPAGPNGENHKLLRIAHEAGRLHLLCYDDFPSAAAYHRRNGAMLGYGGGVDLCLAFPSPKAYANFVALYKAGKLENLEEPVRGHGGTINCISQAKMRDIPTKVTGRR